MSPTLPKSLGKRDASKVPTAPDAAPETEPIREACELQQLIDLWPALPSHAKESILLLARTASAD